MSSLGASVVNRNHNRTRVEVSRAHQATFVDPCGPVRRSGIASVFFYVPFVLTSFPACKHQFSIGILVSPVNVDLRGDPADLQSNFATC